MYQIIYFILQLLEWGNVFTAFTHWIVNRVTLLTQTKLKYKERFCNDMHTTKIMHQQKLKLSWISSQLSNSTNTILDEWLLSYVN